MPLSISPRGSYIPLGVPKPWFHFLYYFPLKIPAPPLTGFCFLDLIIRFTASLRMPQIGLDCRYLRYRNFSNRSILADWLDTFTVSGQIRYLNVWYRPIRSSSRRIPHSGLAKLRKWISKANLGCHNKSGGSHILCVAKMRFR
jgi:hypothetical protein